MWDMHAGYDSRGIVLSRTSRGGRRLRRSTCRQSVPVHGIHSNFRIGEGMPVVSDFKVITPESLGEALDALSSLGNVRVLAGGTDVMVQLEAGSLKPCTFLNIQDLPELRSLQSATSLTALTTYRDVRTGPLKDQFPLLALAAREVGSLAIQSRGTWVGNVVNASPAADGVPALMVYDAELEIRSKTQASYHVANALAAA